VPNAARHGKQPRAPARPSTSRRSHSHTANPDAQTGREIMGVFDRLLQAGNTHLPVTNGADVAAYANRTVHLRDGQIESDIRRAA